MVQTCSRRLILQNKPINCKINFLCRNIFINNNSIYVVYFVSDCPEVTGILEKRKNCDNGIAVWLGQVALGERKSKRDPRGWMRTNCLLWQSLFVHDGCFVIFSHKVYTRDVNHTDRWRNILNAEIIYMDIGRNVWGTRGKKNTFKSNILELNSM